MIEPRTAATMRLREALDMERKTSSGSAMTPLRVAGFISGPWLDYIAEPYRVEAVRGVRERYEPLLDFLAAHLGHHLSLMGRSEADSEVTSPPEPPYLYCDDCLPDDGGISLAILEVEPDLEHTFG